MKLFAVSLAVLLFIIVICVFGTLYGTKTLDGMILELNKNENGEKIPQNAEKIYQTLSDTWERESFKLSLLLPHHHLDEVKEKLVTLGAYSATEEFAEWRDAVFGLNEELEHIRALVGVSFDNIL